MPMDCFSSRALSEQNASGRGSSLLFSRASFPATGIHLVGKRPSRKVVLFLALAALVATPCRVAWAQNAPNASVGATASSMPATPTTRVLAIGRLTKPPTTADFRAVMPGEVRDTVELYLAGKIADWYVTKDAPGVVFILDVRSVEEARDLTKALPLVKAGLMQFQLIPLGPLAPLKLLTN